MNRRQARRPRPVACMGNRYAIEQLEPRLLLANVTWDGGGGDGLWTTGTNWMPDGVPDADDTVFIFAGADVTINAATPTIVELFAQGCTLRVTLGNLTTSGIATFTGNADFRVSAGTVTTGGLLSISNSVMTWSGGLLDGAGSLRVDSLADSELKIQGDVTLSTTLENRRTVNWTSDDITLDDGIIDNSGASAAFNANSATGEIIGLPGRGPNANRFDNAGFVNAIDDLVFGDFTEFRMEGGELRGDVVIGSGSTMTWSAGTMIDDGTISDPSMTIISDGTILNINGSALKTLSREIEIETNGIVNWNGTTDPGGAGTEITFDDGKISNNGFMNLIGKGAALAGPNSTIVNNGEVNVIGIPGFLNSYRFHVPLNNAGTVSVDDNVGFVVGGGSATGDFDLSAGSSLLFREDFSATEGYTLHPGSEIVGPGDLFLLDAVQHTVGGAVSVTRIFVNTGASVTFTSSVSTSAAISMVNGSASSTGRLLPSTLSCTPMELEYSMNRSPPRTLA